MQTGTKKTPDRFQNYFCPAAANDIVHHAGRAFRSIGGKRDDYFPYG